MTRYLRSIPVILTLGLLLGLGTDMLRRPRAADAEPFHRRVREAAERIPMVIGDWKGEDHEVTRGAVALLRPNVILQRLYKNSRTGQQVNLLVVQCKDARDMGGHNPPNCYPAQGWSIAGVRDVNFEIAASGGKLVLPGREYEFTMAQGLQTDRLFVDHLIILPDGTLVRNVDEIRRAGSDLMRRCFGAAQIQFVFDESVNQSERMRIVGELVGANMQLIDALRSGGKR